MILLRAKFFSSQYVISISLFDQFLDQFLRALAGEVLTVLAFDLTELVDRDAEVLLQGPTLPCLWDEQVLRSSAIRRAL